MKSNDSVKWERRERDAFPHAIHLYSTLPTSYLISVIGDRYSIVSSKKSSVRRRVLPRERRARER